MRNLRLTQGYTAAKTESGFEPSTVTTEPAFNFYDRLLPHCRL